VSHRHLDIAPDTPAEQLPSAAIVDTLERGDLDDWRPIAAAVARDPLGAFAERVLHLVNAYPMYGSSPLWRMWIDRCRARAEGAAVLGASKTLAEIRRDSGLTQTNLADRIGMSQSDLSKLERRNDVRISTLRAYLEALGGSLRIVFESGGIRKRIRIGPGSP
jgi:DNA-binding Xre family transcriptional regulator